MTTKPKATKPNPAPPPDAKHEPTPPAKLPKTIYDEPNPPHEKCGCDTCAEWRRRNVSRLGAQSDSTPIVPAPLPSPALTGDAKHEPTPPAAILAALDRRCVVCGYPVTGRCAVCGHEAP